MLFKLILSKNTILSCFFFVFLIIDLYLLIYAVTSQVFNFIAELVIPTGIPAKEANAGIKTHQVTVETKIRKHLI